MFFRSSKPVVLGNVLQYGVFRMERQRDEGDEAVGIVLQLAQLDQVIDAVLFIFNVTVEHGAVGMQAEFVSDPRGLQPFGAVDFVIADDAPHALAEDFRAAARHRIHAGVPQPLQRFANAEFGAAGQKGNLHHGESLQVHLRKALFQAPQHFAKPIERKLRVQAPHDVKFRHGLAPARACHVENFIERHRVRLRIFRFFPERAKPAARHAHIGGIDVAIDVEIGGVTALAFADDVGQIADSEQV